MTGPAPARNAVRGVPPVCADFEKVRARFGAAADILNTFSSWKLVEARDSMAVAMLNPELDAKTCLFGYIDFPDDMAAARGLFPGIEAAAREFGACAVDGPVNYSTGMGYKWKISGWQHGQIPPEPDNPPHMPRIAAELGWRIRQRYFSDLIALNPERYGQHLDNCLWRGYRFERFFGQQWRGALEAMFELTKASFAHVPYYAPLRRDYFRDVYLSFLSETEPVADVCLRGSEACGFILHYRNPRNPKQWVVPLVAVAENHRRRGIGSALAYCAHSAARDAGAQFCVHHHMHESSLFRNFTGRNMTIAEYAVFGRDLT